MFIPNGCLFYPPENGKKYDLIKMEKFWWQRLMRHIKNLNMHIKYLYEIGSGFDLIVTNDELKKLVVNFIRVEFFNLSTSLCGVSFFVRIEEHLSKMFTI